MIPLLFYYIVLPLLATVLVLRFIRRYGADPVPDEVRRSIASDPLGSRTFRVLDVEGRLGSGAARLAKVGDFETQEEAIDAAYARRGAGPTGHSWLVLNDRGEMLQEIL